MEFLSQTRSSSPAASPPASQAQAASSGTSAGCRHRKSFQIPDPTAPPGLGVNPQPQSGRCLWFLAPPPAPPLLMPRLRCFLMLNSAKKVKRILNYSATGQWFPAGGTPPSLTPQLPFSAEVGFFSIRLRGGWSSSPTFTSTSVNESVSSLCATPCPKTLHHSSTRQEIVLEIPILQMRNLRHGDHRPGKWRRQNLSVCSHLPSCGLHLENRNSQGWVPPCPPPTSQPTSSLTCISTCP